jgi:hypothetical protein
MHDCATSVRACALGRPIRQLSVTHRSARFASFSQFLALISSKVLFSLVLLGFAVFPPVFRLCWVGIF